MKGASRRPELNALAKRDLYTFIQLAHAELNPHEPFLENWHIELLASQLMAMYRGEYRYGVFNLPPRGSKSLCISIAFVAWVLGLDPTRRIMVVSYGMDLAEKLARDTRKIMSAPWYLDMFPRTRISPERSAAHDFETTEGGGRMASSRGGPITGRGAHYIIVDDPLKAEEAMSETVREATNDFFSRTLIARSDDKPKAIIIVTMQRLHVDDPCGFLLKTGLFHHLSLAAIAQEDEVWEYETPFGLRRVRRRAGEALHPEREPLESLADVRLIQGEYDFCAQYLQIPLIIGGDVVPIDKFKRYAPNDLPAELDGTIFSLDTAVKAEERHDYSALIHLGRKDGDIYILGVWRFKLTHRALVLRIATLANELRPDAILIEECPGSEALIQDLTHDGSHRIIPRVPRGDKVMRMMAAASLIEAGRVFLPTEATWLDSYLYEMAAFPGIPADDQVDATSQALNWFKERPISAGWLEFYRQRANEIRAAKGLPPHPPRWT